MQLYVFPSAFSTLNAPSCTAVPLEACLIKRRLSGKTLGLTQIWWIKMAAESCPSNPQKQLISVHQTCPKPAETIIQWKMKSDICFQRNFNSEFRVVFVKSCCRSVTVPSNWFLKWCYSCNWLTDSQLFIVTVKLHSRKLWRTSSPWRHLCSVF